MLGRGARRSCRINFREGWRGHFWQERFASFPLSEQHLLAAARYLELNPVAAGLVDRPGDYRWSSARAHLEGNVDRLVKVVPLLAWVVDWRDFLTLSFEEELDVLYLHERTGRPLGDEGFILPTKAFSFRSPTSISKSYHYSDTEDF